MAIEKATRPTSIILLTIFLIIMVIWNGSRLIGGLFFWKTLNEYKASLGPLYLTTSGGIWSIIDLIVIWGLWQGKSWGRAAVVLGLMGYETWYWFDRLVLQIPRANWPFELAVTLIIFFLILITLFSRNANQFFRQRESHERHISKSTN